MPVCGLPGNANLEHLGNQAKLLQRLVRERDPGAIAMVQEFHPRYAGTPAGELTSVSRADAQLVVARRYGFASWPRLRHHVTEAAKYARSPHAQVAGDGTDTNLADQFLRFACLTYGNDDAARRARARQILVEHPEIATANVYTMAAVGEAGHVATAIASDPSLVNRQGGPFDWEPLLYACYSRLDSTAPGHSTLEVARVLLEHGADPNAGYLWEGLVPPFTALTGAFGEGEDAPNQPPHQYALELARLLLEAGADPNDGQALYNRHFRPGNEHLELLFEYGLGTGDGGPWRRRFPRMQSPAEMLEDELVAAAASDFRDRVRLLLDRGVDPNCTGHPIFEGRTAYEVAVRNGNAEVADMLLAAGAEGGTLDPADELAAACLRGDRAEVDRLVAGDAGLLTRVIEEQRDLLVRAVELGRAGAVRLLVMLGFDVNRVSRIAPLHQAAWSGDLDMVRLLVELGADPSVQDDDHHSTPLGWAEHCHNDDVAAYLRSLGPRVDAPA